MCSLYSRESTLFKTVHHCNVPSVRFHFAIVGLELWKEEVSLRFRLKEMDKERNSWLTASLRPLHFGPLLFGQSILTIVR